MNATAAAERVAGPTGESRVGIGSDVHGLAADTAAHADAAIGHVPVTRETLASFATRFREAEAANAKFRDDPKGNAAMIQEGETPAKAQARLWNSYGRAWRDLMGSLASLVGDKAETLFHLPSYRANALIRCGECDAATVADFFEFVHEARGEPAPTVTKWNDLSQNIENGERLPTGHVVVTDVPPGADIEKLHALREFKGMGNFPTRHFTIVTERGTTVSGLSEAWKIFAVK